MFGSFNEEYEPLPGTNAMTSTKKRSLFYGAFGAALVVMAFFAIVGSGGEGQAVETEEAMVASHGKESFVLDGSTGIFTSGQFDLIYNVFSLAIAAQGAATIFFFFQFSLVATQYRTAMAITGLVTLIACYHYMRIFNSFNESYVSSGGKVRATGVPFNDAYRYVDWLLTVPLLLTELILVMQLPQRETVHQCVKLGGLAALMVILGYPGEISMDHGTRWIWWCLAMVPFSIIVYTLFFGLKSSIDDQPEEARGLVKAACYITILSWCTYPIVYVFPMVGLDGAAALCAIQVGYSVADIIAKPIMGLCCWMIAARKTEAEK